jgi:hypothetical protein
VKTYIMYRSEDVSGLSGEGIVAEVVEWADSTASMRWLPTSSPHGIARDVRPTTVEHPHLRNVLALHDHDGRTFLREILPSGSLGEPITFADLS